MSEEKTQNNINSIDRLIDLPNVFHISWLRRKFEWDAGQANVYLSRWKEKKWIMPAGQRSGVYYNTLKDPLNAEKCVSEAALLLYPTATVTGVSVLHAHGWTTQIPNTLHLSIIKKPSIVELTGVSWVERSRKEFVLWQKWLAQEDLKKEKLYGLPSLPPALALADMWRHQDQWMPDPDDVDISEQEGKMIMSACEYLKVDIPFEWKEEHGFLNNPQKEIVSSSVKSPKRP